MVGIARPFENASGSSAGSGGLVNLGEPDCGLLMSAKGKTQAGVGLDSTMVFGGEFELEGAPGDASDLAAVSAERALIFEVFAAVVGDARQWRQGGHPPRWAAPGYQPRST